ncbi:MAG: hypothetical protein ACREVE_16835 [Gammaproteobacteria bacterium]
MLSDKPAAARLARYMLAPAAREVLAAYGFDASRPPHAAHDAQ